MIWAIYVEGKISDGDKYVTKKSHLKLFLFKGRFRRFLYRLFIVMVQENFFCAKIVCTDRLRYVCIKIRILYIYT